MNKLHERLVKATGPDREIDCFIAVTLNPKLRIDYAPGTDCLVPYVRGRGGDVGVPRFTESIDAALTLVPEGWRTNWAGQVPMAAQWFWELTAMHSNQSTERVWAPTAPLAICITAFMAREAASRS